MWLSGWTTGKNRMVGFEGREGGERWVAIVEGEWVAVVEGGVTLVKGR